MNLFFSYSIHMWNLIGLSPSFASKEAVLQFYPNHHESKINLPSLSAYLSKEQWSVRIPIVRWMATRFKDRTVSVEVAIDVKPGFVSQVCHQNENMKIFLRQLPLSRFLAKTLRVNKIAMRTFSKIFCLELTLNCRSHHSCIKLTHPT